MTHSILGTSIIVAAKDQVSCDVGGEAAILSLKNGVYYGLNPIGARVWTLIQEPVLVNTVRDLLLGEYDVDAHIWEQDLLALLAELSAQGLVAICAEGALSSSPPSSSPA